MTDGQGFLAADLLDQEEIAVDPERREGPALRGCEPSARGGRPRAEDRLDGSSRWSPQRL